jgi:hypothetical protein
MSARPRILPEDPFPPLETLVTADAMMATEAGVLRAHRTAIYGLQGVIASLHGRLRQLAHTQQLITETQRLLGQTRSRLDRAADAAAQWGKA